MKTLAPRAASSRAEASPMPVEPPVTIATFPWSDVFMFCFSFHVPIWHRAIDREARRIDPIEQLRSGARSCTRAARRLRTARQTLQRAVDSRRPVSLERRLSQLVQPFL